MSSNAVGISSLSTPLLQQPSDPIQLLPTKTSSSVLALRIFSLYEKNWIYVGKFVNLARYTMSSILSSTHKIGINGSDAQRLQLAVNSLKIFSIIGIITISVSTVKKIQKIQESLNWKDKKGTLFYSLGTISVITGTCAYLTNWVNALLTTVSSRGGIPLLYKLESPFSYVSLTLDSISSGIHLKYLAGMSQQFNKSFIEQLEGRLETWKEKRPIMKAFLKSKIGASNNPKDVLKQRECAHQLNEKTVLLLKSLEMRLQNENFDKDDVPEILNICKNIRKELNKDKKATIGYLIANGMDAVGVTLFYFPITTLFSYLLFGSTVVIRFSLFLYQKN